jgi:hypothetical protein
MTCFRVLNRYTSQDDEKIRIEQKYLDAGLLALGELDCNQSQVRTSRSISFRAKRRIAQ